MRIIGKLTAEMKESLQETSSDYSNVVGISDSEILQEYKESDLVYFASLYEGFGLPIIEAQKVGRPVLTSGLDPMKSVAGKGAFLVDPTKVDEIRDALKKLINDTELRERLIEFGLENCQKFSLESVCRKYLKVYEKI